MQLANGVQMQSLLFQPNGVEMSFIEPQDVDLAERTGIGKVKTYVVPPDMIEPELVEVAEALQALVERLGVLERNPPASFRR